MSLDSLSELVLVKGVRLIGVHHFESLFEADQTTVASDKQLRSELLYEELLVLGHFARSLNHDILVAV